MLILIKMWWYRGCKEKSSTVLSTKKPLSYTPISSQNNAVLINNEQAYKVNPTARIFLNKPITAMKTGLLWKYRCPSKGHVDFRQQKLRK